MERDRIREFVRNFPENGMKLLLENPGNVRDLLGLTGPDWVPEIDLERLVPVEESFVKSGYRRVETDVVLRAPLHTMGKRGENLWIYILVEHQSEKDLAMPLRLLQYVVEIYAFQGRVWRRSHGARSRPRLERVLPVVLYTGTRRWDDLGTLVDMVEPKARSPGDVPFVGPLFLSLPAIEPDALETEGGYFGWVLRLVQQRKRRTAVFRRALARLVRHVDSMPEDEHVRWQEFLSYIHALVYHVRNPTEHSRLQRDIEATATAGAHRQEVSRMGKTIAEDLMEKGHALGQLDTARATLIRLLSRRFGDVPEETNQIIESTSDLDQLNTWLDRFATAETLDDVGVGS